MPNVASLSSRALVRPVAILSGVILSALWAPQARAQLTPVPGTGYSIDRTTETYSGCPGTLTNLTTGDGGGFKGALHVSLPFDFNFYDGTYTSMTVIGAGAVSFPGNQAGWPTGTADAFYSANDAVGDPAEPNSLVSLFWDDIEFVTGRSASIDTSVTGTAPNREFCVQWVNGNYELSDSTFINMKIVLHEGAAGAFDVHYGPQTGTVPPSTDYTATMGVEDSTGGRAFDLQGAAGCSPSCTSAVFTSLEDTKISLTRDAGPEVYAQAITPPEFVFLGAAQNIPVTVGSLHVNPIGPFDISVYVANNPEMTGAVLGGTRRVTLQGYELLETTVETVAPVSFGEGPAYYQLVVDSSDEIAEASEANNSVVSARSRLLVGAPDLAVGSVRPSSTMVSTDAPFDLFVAARNVGAEAVTDAQVAVMLSTNPSITRFDTELLRYGVDLAPVQTDNATVSVTLPAGLASGTYYIGVLMDPDATVDELDEVNNGLAYFEPITVSGAGVAVATTDLPTGTVLQQYFAILAASGGAPPFRWQIESGNLPAGIGFVPETGQFYGVPEAEESQSFTVVVTDGTGATAQATLTLSIVEPQTPLTIVTRDVPIAVVGQEYSFELVATGDLGDSPQLEWSATGLPEGISMVGGYLTGTPTVAGSYPFTASVSFDGDTATRDLTMEVAEYERLQITPVALSTAHVEQPYSEALHATGGTEPYTWLVESGNLPDGLSITPNGRINGTPSTTGAYRFVVRVLDSGAGFAASDLASMRIVVADDANLEITLDALPEATVGEPYAAAITAVGGRPPYTWTIADGALPDGVVGQPNDLDLSFDLVGQVSAAGEDQFLIEVVDASGRVAQHAYLLRSVPAPVVAVEESGCTCVTHGARPDLGMGVGLALFGLVILSRRRRR